MSEYQKFPQPEQLKVVDPKYTMGQNKSKRGWKVGVKSIGSKNWQNKGAKLSWQQKTKLKKQKEQIRQHLKQFKQKRIQKRKDNKQKAKQRKRIKQLNQIKAGTFQVVKNPKQMRKWNKKLKKQIVKVPAQVFQSLMAPK